MRTAAMLCAAAAVIWAGTWFAAPSATHLHLAVALCGAALLGALTLRRPDIGVCVAVPVLMWPLPLTFSGYTLQAPLIILLGLAVLASRNRPALSRSWLPLALVAGVVGLTVLSHVDYGPALYTPAELVRNRLVTLCADVLLVAVVTVAQPRRAVLFRAVGASSVGACAFVLYSGAAATGRILAAQFNPNSVGHIAAVCAVMTIGLAAYTARRERIVWAMLAVVPLAALYEAESRGAYIVAALGLFVLLLSRRQVAAKVLIVGGAVVMAVLSLGQLSALQDALLADRTQTFVSTDARVKLLSLGERLIESHPLGGVGFGHYFDSAYRSLGLALEPHNDWIRIGAESGLPCLILLLILAGRALTFPLRDPLDSAVRAALVSALAAFLFTNTMADLRVSLPAWALLGTVWNVRPPTPVTVTSGRTQAVAKTAQDLQPSTTRARPTGPNCR